MSEWVPDSQETPPSLDRHQQSPSEGHTPLLGRKQEEPFLSLASFSRSGFYLGSLGTGEIFPVRFLLETRLMEKKTKGGHEQ